MWKFGKYFFFTLIFFTISGCFFVESDVSRFSSLNKVNSGGSFFIHKQDNQKGSAEFIHYARGISLRLQKLGFYEVNDLSNTDYVVTFNYGMGGSRERTASIPIYGQTGGGTAYQSGTVSSFGGSRSTYGTYSGTSYTIPTYGVVDTIPISSTVHDRYFVFKMIDHKRSTPNNVVPVYEATVKSSGSSGTFGRVADCIFDAVFDDVYKSGSGSVTKISANCGKKK